MVLNYVMCTHLILSLMLNSLQTFGNRVLGSYAWMIPLTICWSVFGTCMGAAFVSGRVPFVAANQGQFPQLLGMLHYKRNTPVPAVLLYVSLVSVLFVAVATMILICSDL